MSGSNLSDEQEIPGYQLRFWFVGVQPIIWRRLLLRADNTLADLHYAIQICCNWTDDFLHQFKIHGKTIGVPRAHGIWYSVSAGKVTLADLNLREKERFLYEYNFFDNWQLEIRVEKPGLFAKRHSYPRCIGGKRAAPPESCGGPEHFNQLRTHYSPFYTYQRIIECYELHRRREQLDEEEREEFEERHRELGRLIY